MARSVARLKYGLIAGKFAAATDANSCTAIIVAHVRHGGDRSTVPDPAQDIESVGIGRRDLYTGAVGEAGTVCATLTGAIVDTCFETGVVESELAVGCEAHAEVERDEGESNKATAVVVTSPTDDGELATSEGGGGVGGVELGSVLGDTGPRAVVVWLVGRTTDAALWLFERFEISPRAEEEAVCAGRGEEGEEEDGEEGERWGGVGHCGEGCLGVEKWRKG